MKGDFDSSEDVAVGERKLWSRIARSVAYWSSEVVLSSSSILAKQSKSALICLSRRESSYSFILI